jgi:protein SCO1
MQNQKLNWPSGLRIIFGCLLGMATAMAAEDRPAHPPTPSSLATGNSNNSQIAYQIPEVKMVRHDGTPVSFPKELDDGRPVILTFIFTSCSTACPLLSQVFSKVQTLLGEKRDQVHMVSITIDPDYDTPERLAEYAKKLKAGPQWQFYTGTTEDSIALQKAFAVYGGINIMNHIPAIFIRAAPGNSWVRLEGLVSPDEVIREYHNITAG